jgi:hypothetical protein
MIRIVQTGKRTQKTTGLSGNTSTENEMNIRWNGEMNSNSKKWQQVIESGMRTMRDVNRDGPSFNACATMIDSPKYLSEYLDSKGFVREQILR